MNDVDLDFESKQNYQLDEGVVDEEK